MLHFIVALTLLSQAQSPERVLHLPGEQIWGIDFSPSFAILSTKSGKIFKFEPSTKKGTELLPRPESFPFGQGGLMDIRFHPQQSKNGWIYWSSTVGDSKAQTTRISRAKLIDTRLTEIETVFEARPLVHSGYHFGSRITWDSERALYITLGERNERHRAQKKDEHWGKVVRIDDTGAVTIYTYGHRNPQGIAYDSMSGELFVSEHGPKGGDELNRLVLGANYGWPTLTAGREYWGAKIAATNSAPGFESPLLTWVPSIAPGSLHFFSDRAHSSLRGKLGAGALKEQHLNVVAISRDSRTRRIVGLREEQRLWATLKQRIRALAEAPNGDVYFGTDSGELYRFSTDFELNPPASPKTTR